jgi:alanine racemase
MTQPVISATSAVGTPIPRVFRPERTQPSDVVRPTRAEISLENLRFNLRALQRRTAAPIWCVVKADGYGHGAKACARTLERAGAAGLCVSLLEEGIELRNAGISLPILVMGGYYGRSYSELLHNHLTPVLFEPHQVAQLASEVRYRGAAPARVHLKLDTGMGRLGTVESQLAALGAQLAATPEVSVEALMTHFACADHSLESVRAQLQTFDRMTGILAAAGVTAPLRHAANSAAILRSEEAHLDLVRPGLGLFGVEPVPGLAAELRPVMRVSSTLIATRELAVGQSVGYGSTWTAQRRSKVATIPMGYADGLARASSNRGAVLVRGKRAPIVGAVSMDMTTIDVTDLEGAAEGDEVVVLGEQKGPLGSDRITATEIAQLQGTIPWEVLTSVSRRVPRFYRGA